MILWYW